MLIPAFVFLGCKTLAQKECFIADGKSLEKNKSISSPVGLVTLAGNGVHDTIAIDLLVRIADMDSGNPVPEVLVEIISEKKMVSDASGHTNFIAFHNSEGVFNIKLSHSRYHCILINDLSFSSGQIRWLEVKLKKRE